jgi:ubiquitin-protein ligase E3 A
MFHFDEQTRMYWFNSASLESESEFGLVGALLGLAIYNGVLLDVHFPMVLYKKLLNGRPDFSDLKAAFPELGRGLQALLDYQPAEDVEAVFCRTFEVEYEYYGEIQRRELKPGGASIPVTGDNRDEYVRLYTQWVLTDSVETQFKAFARGFLRICGGPALSMFIPSELELLVCGLPHLDFDALQAAARYEGGFSPSSAAVKWMWEVVQDMSLEKKRQFLSFVTGSDRAPVGGLGSLQLLVQRAGPDTDRLPTTHTCFDALLLPEYSSKSKLQERLLTAITNAEGFGLQ